VWVAGGNDSTLTRIDPSSSPIGVQATLSCGARTRAPKPIFSVAIGPDGVWITRGNTLVLVDPRTDRQAKSFRIPSPVGITTGAGAIWVTTQDERLVRYSPAGVLTGSLSLPDGAIPEYGAGAVWMIVYLGSGAVWKVDPTSVIQAASSTLKGFPTSLGVGEGGVWVAGYDGTLTEVDPSKAEVLHVVELGSQPAAAVAAGEDAVWVAVQRPT
jgi:hypothetical protein